MKNFDFKNYHSKYLGELMQTEKEFKIDDVLKADWILRKRKELLEQIEYIDSLLLEYAKKQRENNKKYKSSKLPNGTFGFRKLPIQWIFDEEKLIPFFRQNGMANFIKTKVTLDKKAIKKEVKVRKDGSVEIPNKGVIDGISVQEQGEKFYCK